MHITECTKTLIWKIQVLTIKILKYFLNGGNSESDQYLIKKCVFSFDYYLQTHFFSIYFLILLGFAKIILKR